jgi:SAM-dependent methyltransferase
VHPFAPASTDLLFSRFGVMFFAQPSESFANMRKALRPDGRLAFACWRTPRDNPWMMLGLQEAYKFVPKLPEMKPEDPGPFSFASEERVHRILNDAGFSHIAMERADLSLDIATGRGLDAAVETVLAIGPASRALADQPPDKITAATQSIRTALTAHQKGDAVPLGGSIWIVTAANSR